MKTNLLSSGNFPVACWGTRGLGLSRGSYFLIIMLMMCPFLVHSQTLMPDSTWEDSKTIPWHADGTTFYNYNGTIFAAVLQAYLESDYGDVYHQSMYPYLYLMNKDKKNERLTPFNFGVPQKNYITTFGYPDENGNPGLMPEIIGQNFFFVFNKNLWYFQQIHTGATSDHIHTLNESYDCFAEIYLNATGNLAQTYYTLNNPITDVIKWGAFQLDSLLFFVGINENSTSSEYGHLCLQQYTLDPNSNRFVKGPDYYVPGAPFATKFGGIIMRLDSLQNQYFLIETYLPLTMFNYVGLITPSKSNKTYTFSYKLLNSYSYNYFPVGTACMMPGALKGERPADENPTLSDRFTTFTVLADKASDGKYHMFYQEFYISGTHDLRVMGQGEASLGNHPGTVSNWIESDVLNLCASYELFPQHFSNDIAGMNGYQQRINYFYPDHNGHLNSAQYLSDMFKLNGIDTEGSYDLDDTVSYPGVQGIWVLSGIVDGAPPCSMNWHVWDSTTALNYHGPEPTAMEIVSEQDSAVTTTSSFDDEWSVGYNFDFSAPGKEKSARLTASVEMKYMGAYQKEIQNKTTWKKTVATKFGLTEEIQEMGSYIWTVPELTRYRYDAYPWWEPRTTTQYAIPNSTMFLFRTTGTVTSVIPTNLDGYPWYITDPNSATLSSWKNGGSRDSIFNQTHQYGFAPIFNLSWTSPENGGADRYLTSAGTTTKCSFTNGFEVKAGIGMKVPDVFKGSVSGSEAAKWTNSVETETEFGSEISANLSELSSQSMGTNISKLQFDVYWLYLDSLDDGGGHYEYTNWWYWSRFNGMKPFYIGYRVNTVRAGITLESPADKTCFANNEIWFNWTADGEPLDNFTVYIAKSCNFNPSSIIWKQKTDNNRAVAAADFKPEPGKTYYWRVSGEGGTGEWIWSHIRSFTIAKPADTLINEISLRVIVYPNPGKNNEVKLSFQAKESGDVIYSVFEASGRMVYTATITYPGNNTATFIPLPTGLKPGVYLTEIRSQGERVLKKLVILY